MSVKSEPVNGAEPYQVRTKRPVKDETNLLGDATPRMPHERDESDDSQDSPVRDDMKRAYLDVMEGQMDTDCREERGVESTVQHPGDANAQSPCGIRPRPEEKPQGKTKDR